MAERERAMLTQTEKDTILEYLQMIINGLQALLDAPVESVVHTNIEYLLAQAKQVHDYVVQMQVDPGVEGP
jgi:hypothetical protein